MPHGLPHWSALGSEPSSDLFSVGCPLDAPKPPLRPSQFGWWSDGSLKGYAGKEWTPAEARAHSGEISEGTSAMSTPN